MNNTHGDTYYSPSTTGGTSSNKTNSSYQPPRGEMGWICPVCGRGMAPSTSYCPCNLTRNITYGTGGPSPQDIAIDGKYTSPGACHTEIETTIIATNKCADSVYSAHHDMYN